MSEQDYSLISRGVVHDKFWSDQSPATGKSKFSRADSQIYLVTNWYSGGEGRAGWGPTSQIFVGNYGEDGPLGTQQFKQSDFAFCYRSVTMSLMCHAHPFQQGLYNSKVVSVQETRAAGSAGISTHIHSQCARMMQKIQEWQPVTAVNPTALLALCFN